MEFNNIWSLDGFAPPPFGLPRFVLSGVTCDDGLVIAGYNPLKAFISSRHHSIASHSIRVRI